MRLSIIVVAGLLCAGAVSAAEPGALPFAIEKETTAITSPLRADGTPDYPRAVNDLLSQGVTPGNNGMVIWVQEVAGTEYFPKTALERFLSMSGECAGCGDGVVEDAVGLFFESGEVEQEPGGAARAERG